MENHGVFCGEKFIKMINNEIKEKKKKNEIVFIILECFLILGGLLSPGYLIFLDWPSGPIIEINSNNIDFVFYAPFNLILSVVNKLLPGWIIQKIILFSLFFIVLFLTVKSRFLPNKKFQRYIVATFIAVNPFVYERLLAGQWHVLAGYFFLWFFLGVLLKFYQKEDWAEVKKIFIILLFTGLVSVHFWTMEILILCWYILFNFLADTFRYLKKYFSEKIIFSRNNSVGKKFIPGERWLKKLIIGGIFFLIISLYWIIPLIHKKQYINNLNFSTQEYQAFSTGKNQKGNILGNVLMMYGFWGENHQWGKQFIFNQNTLLFQFSFSLFIVIVFLGYIRGFNQKETRPIFIWLFLTLIAGVVLSGGVEVEFFGNWNKWLFANIPFWKGFRDTQKWSGVIVVIYGLFFAHGLVFLSEKIKKQQQLLNISVIFLLLTMTPFLWWGLNGQIQPVWYPQEWQMVDNYLQKQRECRAVFLPWHLYYPLDFNHQQLSANPAQNFFHCRIYQSRNPEFKGIKMPIGEEEGQKYKIITEIVTSNNPDIKKANKNIFALRKLGINYIILTNDYREKDLYRYPFLRSKYLKKIIETETISLYKININSQKNEK